MHQEEDENYEDDDYDDSLDYPESQHKNYFKFDPTAWDAWGKWLYDAMKDIVESDPNVWYTPTYIKGWPTKKFPVNSFSPNTGKSNKDSQYLGVNYFKEPIFKSKYFIVNPIQISYIKHLQQHSVHFLKQPIYYKGLFEILN